MKCIVYLVPVLILAFGAETSLAANVFNPSEVMVVAANNVVELDVTMEILDEDAESSSAITNVIELPMQKMHQEQIRNQRRIHQDKDALLLRQEQDSPNAILGEMSNQINEAQQEAEEAKRNAQEDMSQKRGY